MNKKVGVLFVHGMGAVADDFAHDAIQELKEKLAGRGLNHNEVAWQTVYWAPTLAARESRLWVDLSAEHDLNWAKLRKFFVNSIGTIASYQAAHERPGSIYHKIHERVHVALRELRDKLGGEDRPLVVMAHSLGSTIMSNYIWDRQKGRDRERYGANPFERMETLAGLVTLGCTTPLMTVAVEPVTAIDFPPAGLPEKVRKKAKWLNLYDADDVLGWPLKPVSQSYAAAVTEDLEVSVGNILTSWNPANHAAYWTDDSVIKPVAYLVSSLLEASEG